jgi:hypothetical protein
MTNVSPVGGYEAQTISTKYTTFARTHRSVFYNAFRKWANCPQAAVRMEAVQLVARFEIPAGLCSIVYAWPEVGPLWTQLQ